MSIFWLPKGDVIGGRFAHPQVVRTLFHGLTASAILAWGSASSVAADIRWRIPAGGTFSSAGSWFGSVVPGVNDSAVFGLSTNPLAIPEHYTVQFTNDPTVLGMRVEDDEVTLDLNGHSLRILSSTAPALPLEIGTVSGAHGQLVITDGSVGTFGGDGAVLGPTTRVGENGGTGFLSVQSSGRLISAPSVVGLTGGGAATVTGAGASWFATELTVGGGGGGSLSIANGGTAGSFVGVVGQTAVGVVEVAGTGSRWTLFGGSLRVGESGAGTLNISNGGQVVADFDSNGVFGGPLLVAAGSPAGTGAVTVDGAGSRLELKGLSIGTVGTGTVRIQSGAAVVLTDSGASPLGETVLGDGGTLDLDAATLRTKAIKFLGATKAFSWTGGGTLQTGSYDGNLIVPDGGVFEPDSLGTGAAVEILGDYTQLAPASTIAVNVSGTAPSQFDHVAVHGAAVLGGQLQVLVPANFSTSFFQTFPILEAIDDISTAFANVANGERLAVTRGFGSFRVNYGPNSEFGPTAANDVVLDQFQPGADFNADLAVTAADLALWKTGFGTSIGATHGQGDADNNSKINGADLLVWQRQFGLAPLSAATKAVPEPTSILLAALAMVGVSCLTRGR